MRFLWTKIAGILPSLLLVACQRTIVIRVPEPPGSGPYIATFTAEPTVIRSGESTTLVWTVQGSASVVLEEAPSSLIGNEDGLLRRIGRFPESGHLEIRPARSMIYVLSCDNETGSACASITVRVTVEPPIPSESGPRQHGPLY